MYFLYQHVKLLPYLVEISWYKSVHFHRFISLFLFVSDSIRNTIAAQSLSYFVSKIWQNPYLFLPQNTLKLICMVVGNSHGRFLWKKYVTEFNFSKLGEFCLDFSFITTVKDCKFVLDFPDMFISPFQRWKFLLCYYFFKIRCLFQIRQSG